MKKMNLVLGISALAILVGCDSGSDYTPAADASGENIFSTACTECHKPVSGDVVLTVYDKALDILSKGNNVPEINSFFWKWTRNSTGGKM